MRWRRDCGNLLVWARFIYNTNWGSAADMQYVKVVVYGGYNDVL